MPPKSKNQARRRKSNPGKSRSLMTFNVLAAIVVGALVFGTVGAAVIDELVSNSNSDKTVDVSDPGGDPIEQGYRDAVANNPNDVDAITALASYLGNVGKVDEAIQWYEKALTLTPDDMTLRLDFASALASGGKYKDAELQFQKVIDAQPDNGVALLGLARLYRSWSPPRTADAVTWYQATIERAADSVAHDLAVSELSQLTGTPVASPGSSPGAQAAP
jgi:tetratricopeptide (TPR) repeat protein